MSETTVTIAASVITDLAIADMRTRKMPRVRTFDDLSAHNSKRADSYLTAAGLTINDYDLIEATIAEVDRRLAQCLDHP